MSDLITTAQETFREQCIEAFVGLQSLARSVAERAREDRGQTAAEYMGILFIVSAIIVAVVGSGIAGKIGDRVGIIVQHIGDGTKP
jgi:Flp pilus assembly pilin Flp